MSAHLSDELLSAHVDGVLHGAELTAVGAHLGECDDCRRRLDLLAATRRAVAALPDEEPRPLDLSFLPTAADSKVVTLRQARGWRPPPWATPVLAAAAVLVAAAGVGTMALRHPGGGASTASSSGAQPQTASKQAGNGANGSVAQGTGQAFAGPAAAPAPDGAGGTTGSSQVPSRSALAAQGPASSHAYPASGGAVVTLSAGARSAPRGQPLQVAMTVRAGSASFEAGALQVRVRRAGDSAVLLGSGSQTVPPGHSASLYGTWVAGQLDGGSPSAGDYLLEAHVLLTDGTDLAVSLTIQVG